MGSALDRLKKQYAEKAVAAGQTIPTATVLSQPPAAQPVAPTPPAAPPPPVVQPAAVVAAPTPPPAAPAVTVLPAAPVAPPVRDLAPAFPATLAPAGTPALPTKIESQQDAANFLNFLQVRADDANLSVADAVASADTGIGISFAQPFARLKEGNWDVQKNLTDPKKYDAMPAGVRPYTAIYLGYRIGATGWKGAGGAGSSGEPPLYKYALPIPLVNKDATALIQETMHVGSRVQFTKAAEKVKFDSVGRLTPEIHILCWQQDVGFMILTTSGFSPTEDTIEGIKKSGIKPLYPYSFAPVKETIVNKKAPVDAPNRSWDTYWIQATLDGSQKGEVCMQSFRAANAQDQMGLSQTIMKFFTAEDFDGLEVSAVIAKLAEYDPILKGTPQEPA